MKPFEDAIKTLGLDYKQAPNPWEFSKFTGEVDTPLDFKTLAKDIPCQEACPAKTNVPAYIEAIAEHDPAGAESLMRAHLQAVKQPSRLNRVIKRCV